MFPEYMVMNEQEMVKDLNKKRNVINDMIDSIKKDVKGINKESINKLIVKIYSTPERDLAEGTVSLKEALTFLISTAVPFAVSPICGVIGFIVTTMLRENANEQVVDKYINSYEKELEKVNSKIEKGSRNIESYKQIKARLEDGIDKLNNYKENFESAKNKESIFDINEAEVLIDEYISEFESLLEKSFSSTVSTIKHNVKRVEDKIDNTAQNMVDSIKKSLVGDKREEIIMGKIPKLTSIIKKAILGAGMFAVNPGLAAVGLLTSIALSSKIKYSEKKRILNELKEEITIVEEKIKDADSKGDNRAKYQLMRLKYSINRDIERITYHLKN